MIRDSIEDRIAAVLRAAPGDRFCHGCLALEVKVTLVDAQGAVAALDGDPGFHVAEGGCSTCQRHKIVARALRQPDSDARPVSAR